jgi:tRNA(Arg) A34 adenosine deaminase TadA
MPRRSRLEIALPSWVFEGLDLEQTRDSDEKKMKLAIELARRSMDRGGGPFGAAIFERSTGGLLALAPNLVLQHGLSLLHAETAALLFGQAELGAHSLASGSYELFASSEPCVQCLGACYWSGLSRLVCGAPLAAAEQAGFDEGPRSRDWQAELCARGIEVLTGVLSDEAARNLEAYSARGGIVY